MPETLWTGIYKLNKKPFQFFTFLRKKKLMNEQWAKWLGMKIKAKFLIKPVIFALREVPVPVTVIIPCASPVSLAGERSRRRASAQWEGAHACHARLSGGRGACADAAEVPQESHYQVQTLLWAQGPVQPHTGGNTKSPVRPLFRHLLFSVSRT